MTVTSLLPTLATTASKSTSTCSSDVMVVIVAESPNFECGIFLLAVARCFTLFNFWHYSRKCVFRHINCRFSWCVSVAQRHSMQYWYSCSVCPCVHHVLILCKNNWSDVMWSALDCSLGNVVLGVPNIEWVSKIGDFQPVSLYLRSGTS